MVELSPGERKILAHIEDGPTVGGYAFLPRSTPTPTSRAIPAREVGPMLTATLSDTDAEVTVVATGEVDMHTAPVLADVLEAGCDAANRKGALAVDLSGIQFFSVVGLTLLLTTRQRCNDNQVPLLVVAPDSVLRPLRLTGLDDLFDIVPPGDAHTVDDVGAVTQPSAVR